MARIRQERAELTRQAILEGAAKAFDASGFHGTSLTDVVRLAGVTKGALHFHFPSKEALARTLMTEQFQISETVLAAGCPALQTSIDVTHQMAHGLRTSVRVRAGIRLVIEFGSSANPDPAPYRAWIGTARRLLTAAQQAGDVLPSLNVADLSAFLIGSFTGVQVTSYARTDRADLHTRVADLWTFLLPGIVPEHRVPFFDPTGSPQCRAALGLSPAPDSPRLPVA